MTVADAPRCPRALVLCEHDLLGEGLADLLRQRGVEVVVLHTLDPDALAPGLAAQPCLVVVERASRPCLDRIACACPDAHVVDVSRVVGRGVPEPGSLLLRFDAILAELPSGGRTDGGGAPQL